jgi:hypothetical protein
MPSLSKREKILLIVLLIVGLGYVYYRFALTPQLNRLKAAETALENNKKKLAVLRVQEKSLDGLKKEVEDLALKAKEVEKVVPATTKIPEVIMNIRDMTTSSGCTVGALGFCGPVTQDFNKAKAQGTQQQSGQAQNNGQNAQQSGGQTNGLDNGITSGVAMILPLTYQIKGEYSNVMSLLSLIEGNTRKMMVDKMSIAKGTGTGASAQPGAKVNENMLTVNLSISTLFRRTGEPSELNSYPFTNIVVGKANMFN